MIIEINDAFFFTQFRIFSIDEIINNKKYIKNMNNYSSVQKYG